MKNQSNNESLVVNLQCLNNYFSEQNLVTQTHCRLLNHCHRIKHTCIVRRDMILRCLSKFVDSDRVVNIKHESPISLNYPIENEKYGELF